MDSYPLRHEQTPADKLLGYLRGQFNRAYADQKAELLEEQYHDNGAFIRRVVATETGDILPNILDKSDRIVLKPPHPNDIPGFYCEVYAIYDSEVAELTKDDEPGVHAKSFVLRDYSNSRPGQHFWIINTEGVSSLEINNQPDTLPIMNESTALVNPQDIAQSMYNKYSTYSIIASVD